MKVSTQSRDKLIYIDRTSQKDNSLLAHYLNVHIYVNRLYGIKVGLFIHEKLSLLDKGSYLKQGL